MDDLLAEFIAETREMLDASGSELIAWEADPTDRTRIDTIFRFVHTVKGNCGFFDFPELERLSHAAEDALSECRAGRREADKALVDAVLAIIDRIGEMTDALETGTTIPAETERDERLIAALDPSGELVEPAACLAVSGNPGKKASDGSGDDTARSAPVVQRSIRLPVELLDEVMKGVSDMVLARNDLARRLREAGEQPTIDGPFERLSTILADVRNSITRMRMQRLEHLFGSFPRLVRDLSNELGKQVMVDCEGGEVELDREMIEMVRDPLTHIVRNAIDHGIESPSDRLAMGKREIGMLRFSARQSGNQIHLVIRDDGRGLDTAKLGSKALAAGIVEQRDLETMSEEQKHQLIFEPGLSTASEVSAISGRGVGMDVVRANIEKVGGAIEVSSTAGEGTVISLKLPLTLSILSALTVRSGGQTYAIPQSYIEEIVFGSSDNVEFAQAGESMLVTFRGRRVPCLSLGTVLAGVGEASSDWPTKTLALLKLASNDVFALAVDEVLDTEDVVVKPIAPAIMETRLYAGTTLLDDGRPMMLLDIPSIAARREISGELRTAATMPKPQDDRAAKDMAQVMRFVALDGSQQAVRFELVRRIETVGRDALQIVSGQAHAVVEGTILPLEGFDGHELPEGKCRLLRLGDGTVELVYAIREVQDVAQISGDLVPAAGDASIEGTTLIDGRAVSLIDGHTLFAKHVPHRRMQTALTYHLPENSEWAAGIMRPLLEQAGYVQAGDDDGAADLAICLSPDQPEADARHTIRLSDDPRHAGDDVIYRYDRASLLEALERVRQGKAA